MKKFISFGTLIMGMFMFSVSEAALVGVDVCASGDSMSNVREIINWVTCTLMTGIVPLLFVLATVAFLWGVIQFYINPENEEKRKKGKNFIVGGLIGLFVMISMWGLVKILSNTFTPDGTGNVIPTFEN